MYCLLNKDASLCIFLSNHQILILEQRLFLLSRKQDKNDVLVNFRAGIA
jgi:hypothetical protein